MNDDEELITALFGELEEKERLIALLYRMIWTYQAQEMRLGHFGHGRHDDNLQVPTRQ